MDLEITNWNNNNIINELTSDDIFITKSNLNESIIDDSNYVSEDSVTLTEGSVEKDEDSLDYQNEYGNNDSITNSISDEFRDLNEKSISKELNSKHIGVDESNLKPLDYKEELKYGNLAENVLHNIIVESDNGEITSLINTTEIKSDKIDNQNDNLDDLNNFYDCEDSEFGENISDNFENIEKNNLNKSYNIESGKLIDIGIIKSDSLELSSEKSSMTNNCKNANNSDKSELKSTEIFDASSSDESFLDYNNQDFVSSNWLMSANRDFTNDDDFDIENVFSFKKMKLSHFKIAINEPLSLSLEISRKYSQNNNNSYLNVCSPLQSLHQTNNTPIDFTNIYSSSTPYSMKQKNRNKNETFSKSPIMPTESAKRESIDNSSMDFKNKTFNLEETKENKPINTNLYTKPNLVAPCTQIITNGDIRDETIDLASVEFNKFVPSAPAASKLQKPIENRSSVLPEKSNRLNKKKVVDSSNPIPSRSNPQSSANPPPEIDEAKVKSSLKFPMDPPKSISSIRPPSNDSGMKKFFSKTLTRDSVGPVSSLNDVKTRFIPPYDPNRRHTVTEEVLNGHQATVTKSSSRPTSLIKPIGNCRIAKPIRPSSVMTSSSSSDKAQKSLPPQAPLQSSSSSSGIPKTVKTMKKLQKNGSIQRNQFISNNNKIDENSQLATVTIVTPIISENPPIISPTTTNYSVNNPLNRTFDREDFKILKSFTHNNNNGSSSSESSSLSSDLTIRSSSTADSENNNKSRRSPEQQQHQPPSGIYQLAQKEEENLKKHVNNSALIRNSAAFRSLKLPSQIQPRRMMVVPPSNVLKK